MDTIEVDQAVFASSDRGAIQGYQLVCKSAGIDRADSQMLCRWAPTQLPPDAPAQGTLSYFALSDTAMALTRTVWGGPEYSGRGAAQVVTIILVLRDDHFASYAHNPLAVARTAMTVGLLRLPLDMTSGRIPQATLPRWPLVDPNLEPDDEYQNELGTSDRLTQLLVDARRVAVIGLRNPFAALERVLPRLPEQARRRLSFTTGLSPASHRPFQAHFFASADAARRRTLESQNIVCLSVHDERLHPEGIAAMFISQ